MISSFQKLDVVKQRAIAISSQAYLLVDARKWEQPAAITFASWKEFAGIVTDRHPGRSAARSLAGSHTEIHLAKTN